MARNIIGTAACATLATLALATVALAVQPKKPTMVTLPPKSCTWVQSGTVVPSGAYTRDNRDGSLWKCNNGSWSPASKGKGGAKK